MTLRSCISSCLCAGAILLGLLAVSGALCGILHSVGDTAAATAVGAIALVVFVCSLLDAATLLGVLAFATLRCLDRLDD